MSKFELSDGAQAFGTVAMIVCLIGIILLIVYPKAEYTTFYRISTAVILLITMEIIYHLYFRFSDHCNLNYTEISYSDVIVLKMNCLASAIIIIPIVTCLLAILYGCIMGLIEASKYVTVNFKTCAINTTIVISVVLILWLYIHANKLHAERILKSR